MMLLLLTWIFQQFLGKVPLRAVLIIPFVVQITGAVGLVSYLCLKDDRQTIDDLADRFMQGVSERVNQSLSHNLDNLIQVNRNNQALIQQGILELENLPDWQPYFWQQIHIFKQTNSVALATEQQEFLGVERYTQESFAIRLCDDSTDGKLHYRLTNSPGEAVQWPSSPTHFTLPCNPTNHSWYQATKQAGKPIWLLVVTSAAPNHAVSGVANFVPIYDRHYTFRGILGATTSLSQMGETLTSLKIGKTGQAFIIDRNQQLIATSTGKTPLVLPSLPPSQLPTTQDFDSQPQLLLAQNSQDFIIKEVTKKLTDTLGNFQAISERKKLWFKINEKRYFVQVVPLQKAEYPQWLTVIVLPEADFKDQMDANSNKTILLCIAVLLMAILLAAITSRWIAQPIGRIDRASITLANGQWHSPLAENNLVQELNSLAQSFNRMAQQLQQSFTHLETARQQSEEKFSKIFRVSPDPISIFTFPEGHYLDVNDSFLEATGYSRAEIIGRTCKELHLLLDTDREKLIQIYKLLAERQLIRNLEFNFRTRTGEIKIALLSAETSEIDGKLCILSIFKDITLRKQAESQLLLAHQQLALHIENSPLATIIWDREFRVQTWSQQTEKMFGWKQSELLGKKFSDWQFVFEADLEKVMRAGVNDWDRSQSRSICHNRNYHKDGRVIECEWYNSFLRDESGNLVSILSLVQDISARKQAEQTLQEQEAFLRSLYNGVAQAIFVVDVRENGEFQYVGLNPTHERLTGLRSIDLAGKTPEQVLPPEIATAVRQRYQTCIEAGETISYEECLLFQGQPTWWLTTLTPLRDELGRIYRMVGSGINISDRKLVEEALRYSEEQRRLALEFTQVGIWDWDLITGKLSWNDTTFQLLGWVPGEVEPSEQAWLQRVHPEDLPQIQQAVALSIKDQNQNEIEYRILHSDGSIHWILSRGQGIYSQSGEIVRMVGVMMDISSRKWAEQQIRSSEERLQLALEGSGDGLWDWDISTGEFYISPLWLGMLGYRVGELPEQISSWERLIHPDDRVRVLHLLNAHLHDSSALYRLDYRLLTKSGEWKWVANYGKVVLRDEQGQPLRMIGTHRDISGRKQAEAAMQTANEALNQRVAQLSVLNRITRTLGTVLDLPTVLNMVAELMGHLFNACETAIGLLDESGTEITITAHYNFNPHAASLTGTVWALENHYAAMRVIQYQQPAIVSVTDSHLETESLRQFLRSRHLHCLMTVGLPATSKVIGIVTVATAQPNRRFMGDEVKLAQTVAGQVAVAIHNAQLFNQLQTAKEEADTANRAKSIFLANMSHELRTPLNAILGFAQLMSHSPALSLEHQEQINIIRRSGEHLLTLINDVLDIAKIEAGRISLNESNFDLLHLLDELQEMFQQKASAKQLQLSITIAPNVPTCIRTDQLKLRQVLINLLSNAIKFTERGKISVQVTAKLESRKRQVEEENWTDFCKDLQEWKQTEIYHCFTNLCQNWTLQTEAPTSNFFMLQFEVADTGYGIAPGELNNIFTAFSQTMSGRLKQEGTGLGLTISRKFVELMGGSISVESVLNQGSVFRFEIRAISETGSESWHQQRTRRAIALEPNQPRYRILVVDDDRESRQLLLQLLSPLGFEVRTANNGREAIQIWESWEPNLIWMDMRMPVMDGYEATKQIKATVKGQSTAVIALTASSFEQDRATILSAGCDDITCKPFLEANIFEIMNKYLGVRYVYEETVPALPSNQVEALALTPAALAVLPREWVAALHKATIEGDLELMLLLIDELRQTHPILADALSSLAKNFKFNKLEELTKNHPIENEQG